METKKPLALITGFSGAGKTTLWQTLLSKHPDRLIKVVTSTTRPPREGERHGHDYHFLTPDDFLGKKSAGHFLETSEHYGHHYGSTAPEALELDRHHIPLYVLDTNGILEVKNQYPNAQAFFVHISPQEQYKRLSERTSNPEELEKRLRRYLHEQEVLETNEDIFHILPNETPEDLEKAVEHIRRTLAL